MSTPPSRSYSSSSTGPNTPWLSPMSAASTWKDSTLPSSRSSRHASTDDDVQAKLTRSPNAKDISPSGEWWEHVLPPGQLAERLKRAQRSADSWSSSKSWSSKPTTAAASLADKSIWKRMPDLAQQDDLHATRYPAPTNSADGGSTSSQYQSSSSKAEENGSNNNNNNNNCSAIVSSGHHMAPHVQSDFPDADATFPTDFPSYTASVSWTSPFGQATQTKAFTPTTSPRRPRVFSQEGVGLGIGSTFVQACSSQPKRSTTHLKHFPPSGYISPSLSDTPEASSGDESDDDRSSVTTTTTTTTRHSRTISMTTTRTTTVKSTRALSSSGSISQCAFDPLEPAAPSPISNGESTPKPRRSRHVSFDGSVPHTSSPSSTGPHSSSSSQNAASFSSLSDRDYTNRFDTLPARSIRTRRSRQGLRRGSDWRATSFSAPASRRGSIHFETPPSFLAPLPQTEPPTLGHSRAASVPDVNLLDSLNVAQNQLATAGNVAVTLTRQLSAPLRPVFHFALFLSVSSITVISISCFLVASYMMTVWDDITKRSHKFSRIAGNTRKSIEAGVQWGMRILGSESHSINRASTFSDAASRSFSSTSSSESTFPTSSDHTKPYSVDGQEQMQYQPKPRHSTLLTWPVVMAWSSGKAIACRIIPSPIVTLLNMPSRNDDTKTTCRGNHPSRPCECFSESKLQNANNNGSHLPPRPPLSSLLPSILFTILIAIGAGLASFFASRRAASEAAAIHTGPYSRSTATSESVGDGRSSRSEKRKSHDEYHSPSIDQGIENVGNYFRHF